EASADIRVVVLRAEGEIFSAGNDLGEFAAQSRNQGPAVRQVERFLRNLVTARTPLVAAVQGKAVGVGTTMLLHCDLVVLADDALRQPGAGSGGQLQSADAAAHRPRTCLRDVRSG